MSIESLPHSPLGAGATFYFGPPGAPAGFSTNGSPFVARDVFVGCKHDENAAWSLLPAFASRPGTLEPLPRGRYGRFLAWTGDKWMIGPLVFKLCTPFTLEAIDDQQFAYAPLVCGYLEYDNSHSGATAELIFGMGAHATPFDSAGARGWQFDSSCGFATEATEEVRVVEGRDALNLDVGPLSGLKFAVPPHSKRVFRLVLAWHANELYASRWFGDVRSTLLYGLKNHERYVALSDQRDAEFMRSSISFDEKTQLARETRTWLAATQRSVGDPAFDLSPLEKVAARIRSRAP
jgi:hypothetical protein